MTNNFSKLEGAVHVFPDGIKLRVVQVKHRESEHWITYETVYPKSLSKRVTVKAQQFVDEFGHLFQGT